MGWIGSESELHNTLAVYGCDRDEDGKFKVQGTIVSFMGAGEEFVVGDDAMAFKDGRPVNICNMLHSTSYGLKVRVVGEDSG
jgi:hypothetical protein